AGLPETGDPGQHQAGIVGAQRRIVQPPLLQSSRPERLDDHVHVGRQPPDELLALWLAQVDADRALTGVEPGEPQRQAILLRHPLPGIVPGLRILDFDDLGSEVPQHPPRRGRSVHRPEFEHPHPGEGTVCSGPVLRHVRLLSKSRTEGGWNGDHRAHWMWRGSRNSWMPHSPSSLPIPERPEPPKGASGRIAPPPYIHTVAARNISA